MKTSERRFVAEYLRCGEVAEAARAAGYDPRRARFHGLRLVNKTDVRAAIERGREERAVRTGLTMDRVLLEYGRIAFADLTRVLRWDKEGARLRPKRELDDVAGAIASITLAPGGGRPVRVQLHDKPYAFEALGRYFNVFDAEYWHDDSEGARDRLIAKLDAMLAAGKGKEEEEEAEEA